MPLLIIVSYIHKSSQIENMGKVVCKVENHKFLFLYES